MVFNNSKHFMFNKFTHSGYFHRNILKTNISYEVPKTYKIPVRKRDFSLKSSNFDDGVVLNEGFFGQESDSYLSTSKMGLISGVLSFLSSSFGLRDQKSNPILKLGNDVLSVDNISLFPNTLNSLGISLFGFNAAHISAVLPNESKTISNNIVDGIDYSWDWSLFLNEVPGGGLASNLLNVDSIKESSTVRTGYLYELGVNQIKPQGYMDPSDSMSDVAYYSNEEKNLAPFKMDAKSVKYLKGFSKPESLTDSNSFNLLAKRSLAQLVDFTGTAIILKSQILLNKLNERSKNLQFINLADESINTNTVRIIDYSDPALNSVMVSDQLTKVDSIKFMVPNGFETQYARLIVLLLLHKVPYLLLDEPKDKAFYLCSLDFSDCIGLKEVIVACEKPDVFLNSFNLAKDCTWMSDNDNLSKIERLMLKLFPIRKSFVLADQFLIGFLSVKTMLFDDKYQTGIICPISLYPDTAGVFEVIETQTLGAINTGCDLIEFLNLTFGFELNIANICLFKLVQIWGNLNARINGKEVDSSTIDEIFKSIFRTMSSDAKSDDLIIKSFYKSGNVFMCERFFPNLIANKINFLLGSAIDNISSLEFDGLFIFPINPTFSVLGNTRTTKDWFFPSLIGDGIYTDIPNQISYGIKCGKNTICLIDNLLDNTSTFDQSFITGYGLRLDSQINYYAGFSNWGRDYSALFRKTRMLALPDESKTNLYGVDPIYPLGSALTYTSPEVDSVTVSGYFKSEVSKLSSKILETWKFASMRPDKYGIIDKIDEWSASMLQIEALFTTIGYDYVLSSVASKKKFYVITDINLPDITKIFILDECKKYGWDVVFTVIDSFEVLRE